MNKDNLPSLLYVLSLLLTVGFLISVAVNGYNYSTTLNSAPFWVFVLVDALTLLLPALVCFAAGLILKKRFGKARGIRSEDA